MLKPIIQGKIIYGPVNDETKEIMSFANKTFDEMNRLREFFGALGTSIKMLKTNKEFRSNFDNLLNLAKSPFIQAILGGAVDVQTIEMVLNGIVNDPQVADVIETIENIFKCFSVDRFIGVKTEKELEDVAYDLAKKKLFYAGVFFTSDLNTNETSYKLRMEVDNTPVTIENKNRFWFPGPEASFELEMRYHRGFIEVQNSFDTAIIKYQKKKHFYANKEKQIGDDLDFSDLSFDGTEDPNKDLDVKYEDDFEGLKLDTEGEFTDAQNLTVTETSTTPAPAIDFGDFFKTLQDKINISAKDVDKFSDDGDFWNFDDDDEEAAKTDPQSTTVDETEATTLAPDTTTQLPKTRKKRQLESILSMFGFGANTDKSDEKKATFEVDDMKFFTKQFPYPKYTRDDFKKGL